MSSFVSVTLPDEEFNIGVDSFDDIEICPTQNSSGFYYFFNKSQNKLIKQFILDNRPQVKYLCQVTLIKNEEKFTPRVSFSIRGKRGQKVSVKKSEENSLMKATVNLGNCYENFWKLISFIESLGNIDIPEGRFSLISKENEEIVSAIRGRNIGSIKEIIKQLSTTEGLSLSEDDINQLLNRRERVLEFENALIEHGSEEGWWQNYFDNNKWIFGYGLNYQILNQEQTQPHYGGTNVEGTGGQRGDYLMSTCGDISFTVLVEIKTPNTPLLQGDSEIRSGAWSLSKNLIDSLSQIQANIQTWDHNGSNQPNNRDRFDPENIFTIQPKGIIVIGSLNQFGTIRNKRETFQRFRKSIHGIDVITFDELLFRAKYIANMEPQELANNEE